MADTKKKQEEQEQTQPPPSSGIPDFKTDRDEVRRTSQQFFRSLIRAGVHLAMAPVYTLPEEPQKHFITAGREFTLGLSTLAQKLADDFDKLVSEWSEEVEK
jgi:hypothetical protein